MVVGDQQQPIRMSEWRQVADDPDTEQQPRNAAEKETHWGTGAKLSFLWISFLALPVWNVNKIHSLQGILEAQAYFGRPSD